MKLVVLFLSLGLIQSSNAMIFAQDGSAGYNTNVPSGSMSNAWNLQGTIGGFLMTPISSNAFLAAQHIGTNGPVTFRGVTYTTTGFTNAPTGDLRVWYISNATFPAWAKLCTNSDTVGALVLLMGTGVGRGNIIATECDYTNLCTQICPPKNGVYAPIYCERHRSITNGWEWGGNAAKRWGTNIIDGTNQFRFSTRFTPTTCALTGGDSSGGAFVFNGSEWVLAGINYAVDTSGASLLDQGGYSSYPCEQATADQNYISRVSQYLDWIYSVLP
jgi:hypothetical protein